MSDCSPKLPAERTEKALDAAAIVASFTPVVGGAISSVLGGMSQSRKFNRVVGMLKGLSDSLAEMRSEVDEDYVRTEDFEDLLEQTLRKVADERSDEVRELYRKFLLHAMAAPGDPYDDQVLVLKALEHIRVPHLVVLRAVAAPPSPDAHRKFMGSPIQTLRERTGLSDAEVKAAVQILNDVRLTNLTTLSVMMTGLGSESLQGSVTTLGLKALEYVGSE